MGERDARAQDRQIQVQADRGRARQQGRAHRFRADDEGRPIRRPASCGLTTATGSATGILAARRGWKSRAPTKWCEPTAKVWKPEKSSAPVRGRWNDGGEEEARAGLSEVEAWTAANGLTLNPDKTRIGDCRQWGQGFDFLGYRFEARRRFVRKKSLKAFRDKVREKTKRTRGDAMARIVADLNPMLRGWFEYVKHATPSVFKALDGFTRRRLRAILRKQERRPGFGRCLADQQRWPNAFFANLGLVTFTTALEQARRSR